MFYQDGSRKRAKPQTLAKPSALAGLFAAGLTALALAPQASIPPLTAELTPADLQAAYGGQAPAVDLSIESLLALEYAYEELALAPAWADTPLTACGPVAQALDWYYTIPGCVPDLSDIPGFPDIPFNFGAEATGEAVWL